MTPSVRAGLRTAALGLALGLATLGSGFPVVAGTLERQMLAQAYAKAEITGPDVAHDVALLDEIIERFAERHVDHPDIGILAQKAADSIAASPPSSSAAAFKAASAALTQALDPHTAYLPEGQWTDMQVTVAGRFSGVGMELSLKDDTIRVVAPVDGSPAAKAGIKTDDTVMAVDGRDISGLSLGEVVGLIRGPVGSTVMLRLRCKDGTQRDAAIVRDVIRLHPVSGRLLGDVAYVRLAQFSGGVAAQLREQINSLDKQSAFGIKGLILDLRSNPGGLLEEAVKVSDLFLGAVPIVFTKGRDPKDDEQRTGRKGEIMAGIPMAVLIDGGSASASEIVAGALHDNHRARLVGEKSYGKGSVQVLEELSEGGVRVTIARYFRPNHQPVDQMGIPPDIAIAPADDDDDNSGNDVQVRRALESLRQ